MHYAYIIRCSFTREYFENRMKLRMKTILLMIALISIGCQKEAKRSDLESQKESKLAIPPKVVVDVRGWAEEQFQLESNICQTKIQIHRLENELSEEKNADKVSSLTSELSMARKTLDEKNTLLANTNDKLFQSGKHDLDRDSPMNLEIEAYKYATLRYLSALHKAGKETLRDVTAEDWKGRNDKYRALIDLNLDQVMEKYGRK
jgi:hypothetical protein